MVICIVVWKNPGNICLLGRWLRWFVYKMDLLYSMHGDSDLGLSCRAGLLIPCVYYVYILAMVAILFYGVGTLRVWINRLTVLM